MSDEAGAGVAAGERAREAWWYPAGAVAVLALLAAGLLPTDSIAWAAVVLPAEVAATILLLVLVVRLHGPARPVWLMLWAFQALTIAGDVVYTIQQNVLEEPAFPGPADPLYLSAYVALIAGLALLLRRTHPGHDYEAWIDSAIMTGAAASVIGTFVLVPMLEQSTAATLDTVVGIAYPALDLVAASVLVRLLLGRPRGQVALTLVTLAVAVTLVADFVYNVLVINGMEEATPGWLEMLYLGGMLLLTAAGAAPDAGRIAVAVEREGPGISTTRTVGLSVGILTAPLLMAVVAWSEGGTTARLLAVMSVAVIGLVVGRTMLLLSTVERQAQRLAEQARTDSLTGLPNRRTWDFQLERTAAMTAHENEPLTVAMLDLDHFKAYNDLNGHPAGDELLVQCGRAWLLQLPRSAFLARYGGEEFAVLLPGVRAEEADDVLDRLRRATPGHQSVSIGYAQRLPGETVRQALDRADRALYAAKDAGRNRVTAADVPVLDDSTG